MKRRRRIFTTSAVSLAQLAWFALLGLWIYWFVSNNLMVIESGRGKSPQLMLNAGNIAAFVVGLCFLAAIAAGMWIIFGNLISQMKLTSLYDSFISNITHALKSPLASIQLHLDTLSSRTVPAEKKREFEELMRKDVQSLNELIDSILEVARLEQKRRPLQPKIYPGEPLVRSLVEEAIEQFNLPREAVDIKGRAPCTCLADRHALKYVFNNLFDNAIKYSNGPVQLTIDISLTSRRFFIDVSDRGIGIPKEYQREVFKKFRRLYRGDSPSVKGTGLGLYWAREIVRQHRGRVTVISEGRNQGTTFRIELPVAATHERDVPGSPPGAEVRSL